jgi:hypothetical protein
MPWQVRDLVACLKGDGYYVTVNVAGELAWQAKNGPHLTASKHGSLLKPYWDFLANLASSHPKEEVRKWFNK